MLVKSTPRRDVLHCEAKVHSSGCAEAPTGTVMLTFTEIIVIGTALAIILTLVVTVTFPPSFKGLGAAAFTGELYPEQNKTLRIRITEKDTATPMQGEPFPTFIAHESPQRALLSPLGKWVVSQVETAQVKKEIWGLRATSFALRGSQRHPNVPQVISMYGQWEMFQ